MTRPAHRPPRRPPPEVAGGGEDDGADDGADATDAAGAAAAAPRGAGDDDHGDADDHAGWRPVFARGAARRLATQLADLVLDGGVAALALGAVGAGAACLLGVAPAPLARGGAGVGAALVAIGGALAWLAGRSVAPALRALLAAPDDDAGGPIELGRHRDALVARAPREYVLARGDRRWRIPVVDVADRPRFEAALRGAAEVRVRSRRGTGEVTDVWVRGRRGG